MLHNYKLFSSIFLSVSVDSTCFFFWQCEVFVYVSCAQTALLDSKEFLAPVITPFEAVLAFSRYVALADSVSWNYLDSLLLDYKYILRSGIVWHQFTEYDSYSSTNLFSGVESGLENIFWILRI